MPRPTPEVVMEKGKRAWARKHLWNSLIDECYRYAAPGMNPYVDGGDPMSTMGGTAGVPRHNHLYDNTLMEALMDASGRMITESFAPGRHWAKFSEGPMWAPGLAMGDTQREQQAATEKKTKLVQTLEEKGFAGIHSSNFFLGAMSCGFEGLCAGTSMMRVVEGTDPGTIIDCQAVSQASVALEPGPTGKVWGFYRTVPLSAREIASVWPKADKISEPGSDMETKATSPRKYKVGECNYYDPFTGIWYYDLLIEDEKNAVRRILAEEALLPYWITWRYMLLPGEVQGRSPVMAALPAARTVNHAKRVQLQAASIRAVGAYTYEHDGVMSVRNIRLTPGAFIRVKSNDRGRPSISPLDLSGDVEMNQVIMEEERTMIRKTMGTEGLPPMDASVRSPTEILERIKEHLMKRGVPYLRLHEEFGKSFLRLALYHQAKAGKLPEVEAVMPRAKDPKTGTKEIQPLLMDGTDIGVSFHSPVISAQRIADAENIFRWAQMSQQAAQQQYQVGAKTEDMPEALGRKMDVPRTLYRDEDERAEMMQAAQGMEESPEQAEAMFGGV